MTAKDPYGVLGLPRGASDQQIRDAYRKLAKALHPDRHSGDARASERFKDVAAAYQLLNHPQRRDAYLRSVGWSPPDPPPARNHGSSPAAEAGRDVAVRLTLTLEEAAAGASRKVIIKRKGCCTACGGTGRYGGEGSACPACRGTGRVPDLTASGGADLPCRKCGGRGTFAPASCPACAGLGRLTAETPLTVTLPPGIAAGARIVIRGQGHEDAPGGPPGDVVVTVEVKDHPHLQRRGADLVWRCRLTLTQWLEGVTLRVPSLNGMLSLKLDPGAKPEGVLKLRGRGLPQPDGSRGDLLVEYRLAVPETLSPKQKALLKKLEGTEGFEGEG
ncbi:MAG: J domain-containing protein [Candidatus Zixiibacteriota bacterium]|nr:MAG: J domain-containing protein [candidate division Zixibacteria bacterium]